MKTLDKAKTLSGVAINDDTITETAARNLAVYREVGFRVTMGWNSKGPYGDELGKLFHFMDHLYKLRKNNRTVYCAEPYGLDPEDFIEFVRLGKEGWDVSIGQLPLWYPSRTTQILIARTSANRN